MHLRVAFQETTDCHFFDLATLLLISMGLLHPDNLPAVHLRTNHNQGKSNATSKTISGSEGDEE